MRRHGGGQLVCGKGDIDPTTPGQPKITLGPMPAKEKTNALEKLCSHLTSTETHYPGTNLILK